MNYVRIIVLVVFVSGCASVPPKDHASRSSRSQPDVMVRAQEAKWGQASPKLPPGAQLWIIQGNPSEPGSLYTFRVKVPNGYSVPPHWHPMDEHITVLQGKIRLGMGRTFDRSALRDFPAGSYARLPKMEPHFNLYEGESIVQFHGVGPYDIHYVNPADDPNKAGE